MRDWIEIWAGAFVVLLLMSLVLLVACFAMPPIGYLFGLWSDYWEANQ